MQGFAQSPSPWGLFDGVLLVDKMSPIQKMSVAGQLKRLQKNARAG